MALQRKHGVYQVAVVLFLSFVLFSGCISMQSAPRDTPPPLLTPDTAQARTSVPTAAPATTATALLQQTAPADRTDTFTADLPHGITISYPQDWMLEETGVPVTRDYGRDVVNIANLYSPALPPSRRMAGPNPDPSDHTILTVDVDEAGVTDFEGYFNRVTVALQDEYGSIDITRHDLQLSISGYKSYRMDFDAKDLRGTYIFTKAGGTVYIFSFSNPTPSSSEVEAMYRSIVISP